MMMALHAPFQAISQCLPVGDPRHPSIQAIPDCVRESEKRLVAFFLNDLVSGYSLHDIWDRQINEDGLSHKNRFTLCETYYRF